MRVRSRREGGGFFVAHMNPLHIPSGAYGVRNAIEGIAAEPVDPTNACVCKNIHEQIGYFLVGHVGNDSSFIEYTRHAGYVGPLGSADRAGDIVSSNNGIVTILSHHSAERTVQRLQEILTAK